MPKKYFLVLCSTVPPVQNGERIPNMGRVGEKYPFNTIIVFTCVYGYDLDTTMSGSNSNTSCLATGNWSHSNPKCTRSNENNFLS